MNELILCVEPDKFLFDLKILIFMLIVLVISIILAVKKKSMRKAMVTLGASSTIVTVKYIYDRLYETSRYGYRFFIETNNDFNELFWYALGMVVLFVVIFLGEKVIDRFKGGK